MTCILLIDDEETCFKTIELLLYGTKFKILHAISSTEALKVLQQSAKNISCIILDIKIPDISGINLVEEIRKIPQSANIPIILHTGFFSYIDQDFCKTLGVTHCLIKPYSKLELTHSLELALSNQS